MSDDTKGLESIKEKINISMADFIKIVLAVAFAGIGYKANDSVSDVATTMAEMKNEIKETKREIMRLNSTMVRVVTTQENVIEGMKDHEGRIRKLEIQR